MEQVLTGYSREENFFYRLIRKKSFWLVFWILSFSYPIYRSIYRELPPPLPVLYQVPEFSLTNEFGKKFGTEQLNGKFYIANFMFTSCPSTCPALMEKMDKVQKRIRGLGTKAQIVTFTVDPENDTPEVLYKFARKKNTNPFVWNFLTGTKSDLQKIVVDGFKVPMGNKESVQKKLEDQTITLLDIAHTEKVVLVDTKGQIRGYYSTDKISIDKLMIDLGLLVNDSFNYKKSDKKGSI
jgi:protein SCO1/2